MRCRVGAATTPSVLVGIDDVVTRHRDAEWRERVQDPDGAGVRVEHVGQALVDAGRLVGSRTAQLDPAVCELATRRVPVDEAAATHAGLEPVALAVAVDALLVDLLP